MPRTSSWLRCRTAAFTTLTLLSLAGVKPDAGHRVQGTPITNCLIEPGLFKMRYPMYWHYPLDKPHFLGGRSAGAVRRDDWKLIEFFDDGHKELYNLRADRSETNNLAAAEPERVQKMSADLAAWRKATLKNP